MWAKSSEKVFLKKWSSVNCRIRCQKSSCSERGEFARTGWCFPTRTPSTEPHRQRRFHIKPTGSSAEWGVSLCCPSLNLCPVSLFRCVTTPRPLPDFTVPAALQRRERKKGLTQQQRMILLLAQGRSTDVNATTHSAFLSLCKKTFCLTSYYNCADSRYEELQILKGQRGWNARGPGMRPPVFEDIPIQNSYRKEARVPENWIFCLFLAYNLLK